MENFGSAIATMLLALAFVLALAWLALHLVKRLQQGRLGGPAAVAVDVPRFVRALPVGARERVVVMHYRGEEWLLGVTAGGISLLAREALPSERQPSQAG